MRINAAFIVLLPNGTRKITEHKMYFLLCGLQEFKLVIQKTFTFSTIQLY